MGLGGRNTTVPTKPTKPGKEDLPSINAIRRSLPPHVFKPSLVVSLLYCVRSAVLILGLAAAYWWCSPVVESPLLRAALAGAYYFLQGMLLWGVFTLGHDCGHGSFSGHAYVNWVVGCLLHTFILVPYQSWRISHRHHHQNTGHMDRDEIFFPHRNHEELKRVRAFTAGLGLAWWAYLLTGFGPRYVYHFNPNDRLFRYHRSAAGVAVSIAVYIAWAFVLYNLSSAFGFSTLVDLYLAPLFVAGSWLTITTFLHHNEPGVEWYADKEWSFVRGALSSVDRDYWPFNSLIHNIGTHQVHHLFPDIPHYYLRDATVAFRAAFPNLVQESRTPILKAFVKNLLAYVRYGSVDSNVTVYTYGEDGVGHVLKTADEVTQQ